MLKSVFDRKTVRFLIMLLLFLTAVLMSYRRCTETHWQAMVYPDRSKPDNRESLGEFTSLEACRDAALDRLDELNALLVGDYACGKNCRTSSEWENVRLCKETLK